MIEPRRGFHMLQSRDSQERHTLYRNDCTSSTTDGQFTERLLQHDAPEIPVHPALEYEVVEAPPKDHASSSPDERQRHQRKEGVILCDAKLLLSFVGLIIFGSVNAISLKLQAIPMYNYPNFLNLFCNALYIPICFAYIIPAAWLEWFKTSNTEYENVSVHSEISEQDTLLSPLLESEPIGTEAISEEDVLLISSDELQARHHQSEHSATHSEASAPFSTEVSTEEHECQPLSQALTYWDLVVMGALDALASSMQLFAAIYLPGPLLILLPQAAIPLSLLISLIKKRREINYRWTQYLGAGVVVLGIIVLTEPLYTNRRAPLFYCEAINLDNDCTICKYESNRETCLAHFPNLDDDVELMISLKTRQENERQDVTPTHSLCQWIAFDQATREEEILTSIWSLVLIASCVPMTMSTFYKEWAMGGIKTISHWQSDPIYLNGWIAVFQLLFATPLTLLGGIVSTPVVGPRNILPNLWNGFRCYMRGVGSIRSGCHPDSLCGPFSFWMVNLHLVTTVGYSYCMMYCLKYGTTTLFFLALTIMVPLGTLVFVLPFVPETITPCVSDVIGSITIVAGLCLYRFFDTKTATVTSNDGDETWQAADENEGEARPVCSRAFFALQRNLSAALLEEPPHAGDI